MPTADIPEIYLQIMIQRSAFDISAHKNCDAKPAVNLLAVDMLIASILVVIIFYLIYPKLFFFFAYKNDCS